MAEKAKKKSKQKKEPAPADPDLPEVICLKLSQVLGAPFGCIGSKCENFYQPPQPENEKGEKSEDLEGVCMDRIVTGMLTEISLSLAIIAGRVDEIIPYGEKNIPEAEKPEEQKPPEQERVVGYE